MEALLQSSSFVERESFSEESNVGELRKCLSRARAGLGVDFSKIGAGLKLNWS